MDGHVTEVWEGFGGYGRVQRLWKGYGVYRDLDRGAVMQSKELY